MTLLLCERDSLTRRLGWPARVVGTAARALDGALHRPALRRGAKAAVDFMCAAGAVVAAIAVSEGFAAYGLPETATLILLVGILIVLTDTLVGSYRTMWRYTSLPEARALGEAGVTPHRAVAPDQRVGEHNQDPDTLVGSYRTMWRYTSLPEARALGVASILVLVALL